MPYRAAAFAADARRPPRRLPLPRRSRRTNDHTEFDAEGYARGTAALVGLALDPRHLPGITANLRLAARMAAAVEGLPLTPADEPAPIFVAGRDAPG